MQEEALALTFIRHPDCMLPYYCRCTEHLRIVTRESDLGRCLGVVYNHGSPREIPSRNQTMAVTSTRKACKIDKLHLIYIYIMIDLPCQPNCTPN